jgi:hypothetical protein
MHACMHECVTCHGPGTLPHSLARLPPQQKAQQGKKSRLVSSCMCCEEEKSPAACVPILAWTPGGAVHDPYYSYLGVIYVCVYMREDVYLYNKQYS